MTDHDEQKTRYQRALEKLSRDLVDQGLLIEAGWLSLRANVLPPDAGETQLKEMRLAFFAGAQHVFGSILTMLEPGAEPTDTDCRRMNQISDELDRFLKELAARLPTVGSA